MPGIVDLAIARKLVRLLAVLAAALPVALPGQAAVAAERLADLAQRQREVDEGEHIVDTMALLLGPAPGQHHGGGRLPHDVGGLLDLARRHAGDSLDPVGPIGRDDAADLVESTRARGDEIAIDQAVADRHVQEPVGEGRVGPGRDLQVKRSELCGRGPAGIDDDELAAAPALLLEILHQRRHGVGRVAADEKNGLGSGNIIQRERQAAVDPERTQPRRRSGGHAEAAVVVDVGGPQRHARELAEHVGLLVGETAAPEHTDRIGPRCRLDLAQAGGDAIERRVPTHRKQGAALAGAHQRLGQPVARVEQFGRGEALAAQSALVGGKIARRDDQAAALGHQAHAALQSAVGAVGVAFAVDASVMLLLRPQA